MVADTRMIALQQQPRICSVTRPLLSLETEELQQQGQRYYVSVRASGEKMALFGGVRLPAAAREQESKQRGFVRVFSLFLDAPYSSLGSCSFD